MAGKVIHVKFGPGGGRARAFDLYKLASQLDEDDGTLARARALYEQALSMDPKLAIAYTNLGNVYYRMGDQPRAEELYHRALVLDPHQVEALYNLGYAASERQEFVTAVRYLRKALRFDKSFPDAHFCLGTTYRNLGRFSQAHACFARYVELAPKGPYHDLAHSHIVEIRQLMKLDRIGVTGT